ncbi:MAG: hypothetical protein B6I38_02760 [Anaerolineaceae bacterium 4572_5.1]|nr:MAG: hypothetical protein B6I38_02760 [Anaerolineaceae bacterium 4572_5.1]
MNTALKVIARIFAFIFAILLVVAIPVALIAYDAGRVVFNPPIVKQITTNIIAESDLIPVALEWFSENQAEKRYEEDKAQAWVDEPNIVQLMAHLDTEDWREIREEILPNAILEEWISVSVDGTYEWIDNNARVPQIIWDLQPLAERVNSEHGMKAIMIAYESLKPCSPEQIADFKERLAAVPAGTEVLYNLCQFPGTCAEDVESYGCDQVNDYTESLQDLVQSIPSKLELTKELAQVEDTEGVGPLAIKQQLRAIRLMMNLAPLLPLGLLFLVLLFAVRSLKELGMWWGIPLSLGSLITLILALLYKPLMVGVLAAGPLSETPTLIMPHAVGGVMHLMTEIFRPMRWQSLVTLLVGVALIVMMIIAKSESEKEK